MKKIVLLAALFLSCLSLADTPPEVLNFIGSLVKTYTDVSCQTASGSQSGCLDSVDWNTFNSKQSALTFGTLTGSPQFSITGGTAAVIGTGTSISVGSGYYFPTTTDESNWNSKQSALTFADSIVNTSGTVTLVGDSSSPGDLKYYGTNGSGTKGYYTLPNSAVWGSITGNIENQTDLQSEFSEYQLAGSYITAITGDLTATGPGSVVGTLATVNSSPGTYTNATLTVNGKGLVTSASSGTSAVTSVTALSPLYSTGGTTPVISIPSPIPSPYIGSLPYIGIGESAGGDLSGTYPNPSVASVGGQVAATVGNAVSQVESASKNDWGITFANNAGALTNDATNFTYNDDTNVLFLSGQAQLGSIIDSSVTANTLMYANGSKEISSATVAAPLTFSGGVLAMPSPIPSSLVGPLPYCALSGGSGCAITGNVTIGGTNIELNSNGSASFGSNNFRISTTGGLETFTLLQAFGGVESSSILNTGTFSSDFGSSFYSDGNGNVTAASFNTSGGVNGGQIIASGKLEGRQLTVGLGSGGSYAADIYDLTSTGYDIGDSTTGLWDIQANGNLDLGGTSGPINSDVQFNILNTNSATFNMAGGDPGYAILQFQDQNGDSGYFGIASGDSTFQTNVGDGIVQFRQYGGGPANVAIDSQVGFSDRFQYLTYDDQGDVEIGDLGPYYNNVWVGINQNSGILLHNTDSYPVNTSNSTLDDGSGNATFASAVTANQIVSLGAIDSHGDLIIYTHINVAANTGAVTLTSCGSSPAITSGSNDIRGTITAGTGATSCQVNFNTAFGTAPYCTITAANSTGVGLYTPHSTTTSAHFVVNGTSVAGAAFTYICIQ